jgi:hypothetical protein
MLVARRSSLWQRSFVAVFAAGLLLGLISEARAYRPFDGTDAAVADPGEVEVELQPAGAQWSREQNQLIAPAVVLNYGFLQNWEAVLEGQLQTPFSPSGRQPCPHREPSSSTSFARAHFRINSVRASLLNLGFCCRTATAIAVSAPASIQSYLSGGTGEPLI